MGISKLVKGLDRLANIVLAKEDMDAFNLAQFHKFDNLKKYVLLVKNNQLPINVVSEDLQRLVFHLDFCKNPLEQVALFNAFVKVHLQIEH